MRWLDKLESHHYTALLKDLDKKNYQHKMTSLSYSELVHQACCIQNRIDRNEEPIDSYRDQNQTLCSLIYISSRQYITRCDKCGLAIPVSILLNHYCEGKIWYHISSEIITLNNQDRNEIYSGVKSLLPKSSSPRKAYILEEVRDVALGLIYRVIISPIESNPHTSPQYAICHEITDIANQRYADRQVIIDENEFLVMYHSPIYAHLPHYSIRI